VLYENICLHRVCEEKSSTLPVTLHTHGQKHLYPQSNGYREHDERISKELELLYFLDYQIRIKARKILYLQFTGPCIVIYSYNKSQQDALFLNFILLKYSTCFGQICCPSPGVLILYSQQLVFIILVMLTVC